MLRISSKLLPINLLLLLVVFFILPYGASAISSSSISVNVIPANYGPNQNIDISLSSFAADLNSVMITWFVNGKNTLSGIGKKSFSITSGAAGSLNTVRVKILLPDGEIEKIIQINPSVTILLWQAIESHTPPFYRGKAMPTLGSEIKVVAMPEIQAGNTMVDPKNMTYAWRRDYSNEPAGSGYGKNFFIYSDDWLEDGGTVEVAATTANGQSSSSASISIGTVEPQISFYKKDEVMGILWEQALQDGHLVKNGDTVMAIPYFISPKNLYHPDLVFNWSINSRTINLGSFRKNMIPLKVEEGMSGASNLRLDIESKSQFFQTANKEIRLEF